MDISNENWHRDYPLYDRGYLEGSQIWKPGTPGVEYNQYDPKRYFTKPEFKNGGLTKGSVHEMGGAAMQQQQQPDQTEQLVSAVAEMLQKGAKAKDVEGALIKEGIPAQQAKQLVAQVKSRMGASLSQQMPMAQEGAYMRGGEYDMDENQIQELERMGYKFDYLD
jgi:hypothetical protein